MYETLHTCNRLISVSNQFFFQYERILVPFQDIKIKLFVQMKWVVKFCVCSLSLLCVSICTDPVLYPQHPQD